MIRSPRSAYEQAILSPGLTPDPYNLCSEGRPATGISWRNQQGQEMARVHYEQASRKSPVRVSYFVYNGEQA